MAHKSKYVCWCATECVDSDGIIGVYNFNSSHMELMKRIFIWISISVHHSCTRIDPLDGSQGRKSTNASRPVMPNPALSDEWLHSFPLCPEICLQSLAGTPLMRFIDLIWIWKTPSRPTCTICTKRFAVYVQIRLRSQTLALRPGLGETFRK